MLFCVCIHSCFVPSVLAFSNGEQGVMNNTFVLIFMFVFYSHLHLVVTSIQIKQKSRSII